MTKSITSKHQFFFFQQKTQSASCWLWQDGQVQQVHQSSTVKPVVCVCVWGCVSVCAVKNFMYVWSENDILLCATHLCQTCLTGSLWHCALYTLIITTYRHNFSPLSMFHSENLHTCSSIFSSSCAEFIKYTIITFHYSFWYTYMYLQWYIYIIAGSYTLS